MALLMATGLAYKAIYAFSVRAKMILIVIYGKSRKPIQARTSMVRIGRENFKASLRFVDLITSVLNI